ncbi:MAG TPA: F0F1 ATP synthase subunit delta [Actinomycetota bacterium]|jgi:F-type H+-transporting ATPase subunit delta
MSERALEGHARQLLDEAGRRGALGRVATELAAIAELLTTQVRLRKALSDPDLPVDNKKALLDDLTRGALDPTTVELLATAVEHRHVPMREFPELVAGLAAQATFAGAEADGELERLEDELYELGTLVDGERRLRSVLTDPALPVERKQALVADLLRGHASERTAALADLWVVLRDGRDLGDAARELAEEAARRRRRLVAEVRTAVELDRQRRGRLAEVLTRITGQPVDLQCTVDTSILGSVVVRIGDEVYDGSVRSRLAKVRERLSA